MKEKLIITIDGPAGSGKSSTSKALAKRLGYIYVNTGAFYRAVAYKVLKENINIQDKEKIIELAKKMNIDYQMDKIFVDDDEISSTLYSQKVSDVTPIIAQIPEIRKILLPLQRKLGDKGGIVIEGRDAGSVIFPNADFKFYIYASFDMRVKRVRKILPESEKKKYEKEDSLAYYVRTCDEKDLKLNEEAKKKTILYDNTNSPSAEQDAIVLEYYITHKKEIIKNARKWLNQSKN